MGRIGFALVILTLVVAAECRRYLAVRPPRPWRRPSVYAKAGKSHGIQQESENSLDSSFENSVGKDEAELEKLRGAKRSHVTFTYEGETIEETIVSNPETFVVFYTVKTSIGEADIVDDFKEFLRVVRSPDEEMCIVTPLPHSRKFESRAEFEEWIADASKMKKELIQLYVPENSPYLKDTYHLSDEALEICQGLPVYWGEMKEEEIDDRRKRRVKRRDWWDHADTAIKVAGVIWPRN